jgi:peptide/nickel transport system substrate-binding protein
MERERGYWQNLRARRLTRRRLLASTAGGLAVAAAACSSNSRGPQGQSGSANSQSSPVTVAPSPSGQPAPGGIITTSNRDNAPNLDLHRTTSGYSKAPEGAVLSRLLRYQSGLDLKVGADHKVEGDLATSWESPDATTWTVKLRPDAKFHNVTPVNGHAVEAEDIKATVERAMNAQNPARAGLDPIDTSQVQTPDKNTVVFKLKYPFAAFTSTMASPNYFYIFPREALTGSYDPARQVIGSGPFTFQSWTPDIGFVLKKNPSWFEKGRPYVDELHWNVLTDTARMEAEFKAGHLDIMGDTDGLPIPINDLPSLQKDNPNALLMRRDPSAGSLMFVSLGDPASPFQDVRLRRAISLGFDRDVISKAMYNNDAEPQFCAYLSLGDKALHMKDLSAETAKWYKYDPAQAKQLLQASGMTDHEFKLVYFTGFLGPAYEQTGQTLANMLQQSGFKITPFAADYQRDYIGGGKGVRYGNFDKDWIIYTGLSSYDEVDEYMFNYFSSNTTSGLAKLKDPEFDSMLSKARATLDENQRTRAYLDIQRYVADKMYAIAGLPQPYVYSMVNPRVQNYQHSNSYGLGTEEFSKLWIKQ